MRERFELPENTAYFGFHFDDDFLFIGNRDEQYTGGLDFEYIKPVENKKTNTGIFNPFHNGYRYVTTTFGSKLFTPYNVSDSLIILNDRPYSSYIYLTPGYIAYDSRYKKRLAVELYLGIMGSLLPGKVQAAIHTIGESPPTYGWTHRIASCEVFIPNLRINYQHKLLTIKPIKLFHIQALQLSNGYELNAGLFKNTLSYGLKLAAFNYVPSIGSFAVFDTRDKIFREQLQRDKISDKRLKINTYFFPRFELVVQNTTLQGLAWMDSPYTISTDIMNRGVWTFEVGINASVGRFHFNYIVQARSREFKKYQKEWHTWAGISAGFTF